MGHKQHVSVVCTAFGSFQGVDSNPSQWMLEQLQKLQSTTPELQGATFEVLEVAAHYVTDALRQLAAELKDPKSPVIWCHFGVDGEAKHFKLERRAVNEATFRCPDQEGWQPKECCIDPHEPLHHCLESDLPLDDLADALRQDGFDVAVSYDAGRFVCNWTLYRSLLTCRSHSNWHAFFVHVPPFEQIKPEKQLAFAQAVLKRLRSEPVSREGGWCGLLHRILRTDKLRALSYGVLAWLCLRRSD